MRAGPPLLPTLTASLLLIATTACAATTYESGGSGSEPRTAPSPTTISITAPATAAQLLPRLSEEAAGLSQLMIERGEDQASADRISELWQAVRQEVSASRPELVADFDANVRRCQSAVRFRRAADADKAAANLRALVDAYLASS